MNATLTNNGSAVLTVTAVAASSGFGTTTNLRGHAAAGPDLHGVGHLLADHIGATSGAVTFTDNYSIRHADCAAERNRHSAGHHPDQPPGLLVSVDSGIAQSRAGGRHLAGGRSAHDRHYIAANASHGHAGNFANWSDGGALSHTGHSLLEHNYLYGHLQHLLFADDRVVRQIAEPIDRIGQLFRGEFGGQSKRHREPRLYLHKLDGQRGQCQQRLDHHNHDCAQAVTANFCINPRDGGFAKLWLGLPWIEFRSGDSVLFLLRPFRAPNFAWPMGLNLPRERQAVPYPATSMHRSCHLSRICRSEKMMPWW